MTALRVETFGHEPAWINDGYCGGCERCGDTEEMEVCARCWRARWHPGDYGSRSWTERLPVRWPCATAVVLGVEPASSA